MNSLKPHLCSAALVAALLAPSAAIADDQPGAAPPPAGQAAPAPSAQAAPAAPTPASTAEDDEGTSTLLVAGIAVGLLALGGGLAVVKRSRLDGPRQATP